MSGYSTPRRPICLIGTRGDAALPPRGRTKARRRRQTGINIGIEIERRTEIDVEIEIETETDGMTETDIANGQESTQEIGAVTETRVETANETEIETEIETEVGIGAIEEIGTMSTKAEVAQRMSNPLRKPLFTHHG